jgi:hypothetical protein
MPDIGEWQVKARLSLALKPDVEALARRRRLSISRLVASLLERELSQPNASSSFVDEATIREMAILVAAEQILKLQEATIPGGTTLSRRLLADAATAAIARLESIAASLRDDETE